LKRHGYVFIDRLSWDNFNESGDLKSQAEDFKLATGHNPESIHVDQIYRTKENRAWCKERGIRIKVNLWSTPIPPLGGQGGLSQLPTPNSPLLTDN
jgi:hypothetical protein